MISCCFICVCAVLTNKVFLQETVTAVFGGSVLLPCSSTEEDHKLEEMNVFWRHNGSRIVCDIIPSSNSLEKQDPQYKNRIETFPQEYERGNFSIKLNKLIYADGGKYICLITHSSEHTSVQLIIIESTAKKRTESTEQEKTGETELDSVETSSPWLWVGIASVIIVIVTVIAFIVACWIRKNSSRRRADRHDIHEDEHMNQY